MRVLPDFRRHRRPVLVAAMLLIALLTGVVARRDDDRKPAESSQLGAPRVVATSTTTPPSTTTPETTTSTTTTTEVTSTTSPARRTRTVPAAGGSSALTVLNGRFVVDGVERALVGVNASGAASRLMLGSPCGYPDVDLDQMFAALPERALVRVWFTQRMVTNITTLERNWEPIDAVVEAAERSPTRPLLLVTLATGSGDCDGGGWRDRTWYEGGYRSVDAGMPNSYAGWVDEIVTRFAGRDTVAIWEPVNEPDPSTCIDGYQGSGCFGHTRCDPGAADALAGFLSEVGAQIKIIDPNGLVSNGGGGWCGWYSKSERLVIEGAENTDIISVHDYHLDDAPVPDWMWETFERARFVNKPLLVGEVGIGAGPKGGGRGYEDRADLLAAKVQEQVNGGAGAVLLWVYGGFDDCGYCIAPTDPVMDRLKAVSLNPA